MEPTNHPSSCQSHLYESSGVPESCTVERDETDINDRMTVPWKRDQPDPVHASSQPPVPQLLSKEVSRTNLHSTYLVPTSHVYGDPGPPEVGQNHSLSSSWVETPRLCDPSPPLTSLDFTRTGRTSPTRRVGTSNTTVPVHALTVEKPKVLLNLQIQRYVVWSSSLPLVPLLDSEQRSL